MTRSRRAEIHPVLKSCLAQLVSALRDPGADPSLIAQRARRVMSFSPSRRIDLKAWLQTLLTEPGHFDRTVDALNRASAGSKAPALPSSRSGQVRQSRRR